MTGWPSLTHFEKRSPPNDADGPIHLAAIRAIQAALQQAAAFRAPGKVRLHPYLLWARLLEPDAETSAHAR